MNLKATNVFERNWNADKRFIVNQGGTRCFAPDTLVCTNEGLKQISKIKKGDLVKSFNFETKKKEYRPVINTFKMANKKPTVKVTLKNGRTIIATEDHKFWHEGGWISLKSMLKLKSNK